MKRGLSWAERPKLWNRGAARASLMGSERTMNPSAAASSILGMRVSAPKLYNQGQARKRLARRTRTSNPLPAALAVLGKLGGLGKLLNLGGSPRVFNDMPGGGPLQTTVNDLLLRASRSEPEAFRIMWAARTGKQGAAWSRIWTELVPAVTKPAGATWVKANIDPTFALTGSAGSATGATGVINPQLLGAATQVAGRVLVAAAKPARGRSSRVRQVNRYDPETGDKYKVPSNSAEAANWPSRKPSARSLGAGAAGLAGAAPIATKAAGLAGAGAGAIAGVVIGGLAVGLLIGTGLRKLFGTAKAVRAEEAAVQGALVLRNTRAQLEAQLGRKLNATEAKALFQEYTQQLRGLGFIQDAQGMWYRPRSFTERLLG